MKPVWTDFRGWRPGAFARGGAGEGLRAFGLRAALLAALFLTGCFSDEKVAGGDDFPNSVETLGKAAASEGADTASWNAYEEAPSTPPEAYDSTSVPDEPPSEETSALQRRAVGPDGRVVPGFEVVGAVRSVFSLFDSVTGLSRTVRVQTLTDIVVRDTTYFRVELLPPLRRIVRMSGAVTYADRVERFAFEDADGDSVLSPLPGARARVRARFSVEHGSGRTERRTVRFSAGADGRFETAADNVLLSLQTIVTQGADTLSALALAPLPGDSVVRDPQRAFTRVDVEHVVNAGGARVAQSYRARLHADSTRNRALRFRRVVTTVAGTTETKALGRDSAADFAPGDTGLVSVTFTSTESADALASSRAWYRVALADSAAGHGANRLLRVEREKVYRAGPETARAYLFVPSGAEPRAGEVDLRVDLRAGGWIGFTGASSATGFQGVWSDDRGGGGAIRYDVNGAITTGGAAP